MKTVPFSKRKCLRLPSVFYWKPAKRQWQAIFKGMVACLITSYIYMITPVNEYFGALGYLCIAVVIITPPFLPLGSHIEGFALATIGMGVGLIVSAIGMACFTAINRNIGVPNGRWFAFSFLMIVAFLFGYGKAKYPKLAILWILGLIPPMYLLTLEVDTPHFNFLFAAKIIILQMFGCFVSLLVNFVFWPISSTALVCNTMGSVLAQTRDILLKIPEALKTADYDPAQTYQLETKARQIQGAMFKLRDMFRQSRYEVTYGRFDPRQIVRSVGALVKLHHHLRILLNTVLDAQRMRKRNESYDDVKIDIYGVRTYDEDTQRNNEQLITCHLDILTRHTPEIIHVAAVTINRLIGTFEELSDQGQPIMALPQEELPYQPDSNVTSLKLLEDILMKYEEIHAKVSEELHTASGGNDSNDPTMIAAAYMYALKNVIVSLNQIVESQEVFMSNVCKRKRLWCPKMSFSKWLHADSQKKAEIRGHNDILESDTDESDDEGDILSAATEEVQAESSTSHCDETKEKNQENQAQEVSPQERLMAGQLLAAPVRKQSIGTYLYQVQKEKESRRTFRLLVWRLLQWCKSDEIVYAFKFTIIFCCLALPAYFDSSMHWYLRDHGQWALITANIVSNVTVGAMFTVGVQRFIGTILGGLWGLAVWEISRGNQYAIPACFAVLSFPMWYLFVQNPLNKVGSVALTAYVAIIFNEWVYRSSEKRFYIVAFERIATVDAGILVTFLVHSLIVPYIARVELRLELAHLFNLNNRMISGLFNFHNEEDEEEESRILKELQCTFNKVFHGLLKAQLLFSQSAGEPRLRGPFQRDVYEEIMTRLKYMLDLGFVIRATLSQLPKEYLEKHLLPINGYRRELVSIMLLNLYNVSGALRTKSPMPRYLPSTSGIGQLLRDSVVQGLSNKEKTSFELTTYYTYGWAMLEYSVQEEIIIELVKGIVGETELNIRLDPANIAQLSRQMLLFQSKQPHQMKHD